MRKVFSIQPPEVVVGPYHICMPSIHTYVLLLQKFDAIAKLIPSEMSGFPHLLPYWIL